MTQFDYRPYMAGDEHAIITLFAESFPGRTMTMDYWAWRFRDNPAGPTAIELAWQGEKLIAHHSVCPVWISVRGEDRLCGLTVTIMTHPEYRGTGLFGVLANRLYQRMSEIGYRMVFGFPNKNSHEAFANKLGWKDICEIPMLALDLKEMTYGRESSTGIEKSAGFDERFNDLWDSISGLHDIMVKRDLRYLRWRFGSHPENQYHLVCRTDSRRLLGYAVWKLYKQREIEIVDLVAADEESVGTSLVQAVMNIGLNMEVERVRIWLPTHNAVRTSLEQMGFRKRPPWTYFAARLLGPPATGENFFSESAWHYSMSDSDVF